MTTLSMFHAKVPPSEYSRNYSRMIRRPYCYNEFLTEWVVFGRPTRTTIMHSLNTLWTAILPDMLCRGRIWRRGGGVTRPARSDRNFLVLPLYFFRLHKYNWLFWLW